MNLETFLEQVRRAVPLAALVGERVKLTRKGREFQGLCPFHQEKTPSFFVVEDKDFYHCFGCGAHGDHIKFVMETQNLEFREALEVLASMAGIALPQRTTKAPQDDSLHRRLAVLEAACRWFSEQLRSHKSAQEYLNARSITSASIAQFRLGFAPESAAQAFRACLKQAGAQEEDMVQLGLMRHGKMFFRNRIMFPVLDRRGRVIAFGGRYLGDHARARTGKYINSPEHILFQKKDVLYNGTHVRQHLKSTPQVLVVEGYMDVITLTQAGLNSVAPMGTALSESQLHRLWRINAQPVLCFDGDVAGRNASQRAMTNALPWLTPEHTFYVLALPKGQDPDSFIQTHGRQAFQHALAQAQPLSQALFQGALAHIQATMPLDSAEGIARLEHHVMGQANTIQNPTTRKAFLQDFRDRIWQIRRQKTSQHPAATSSLPQCDKRMQVIILRLILDFPALLDKFTEQLAQIHFSANLDKLHRSLHIELANSGQASGLRGRLEEAHASAIETLYSAEAEAWIRGADIEDETKALDVLQIILQDAMDKDPSSNEESSAHEPGAHESSDHESSDHERHLIDRLKSDVHQGRAESRKVAHRVKRQDVW